MLYGFASGGTGEPEDDDGDRECDRRREDPLPPLPSAMSTLAFTILNGSFHERRDASRVLAEMVIEAGL